MACTSFRDSSSKIRWQKPNANVKSVPLHGREPTCFRPPFSAHAKSKFPLMIAARIAST